MTQKLIVVALALCGATWVGAAAPPARPAPSLDSLSNSDAWGVLPLERPPLPAWARVLAASLPRTTAHLLALDHLHREKNPLGPSLAAQLRWIAADENGCAYARDAAAFDLRRAGGVVFPLTADRKHLTAKEAATFTFARKMSRAAHTVTDTEVAELIEMYGEAKVVAMVHTLAFANFQNRVIIGLGVKAEKGGPLAAVEVRLAPGDASKRLAPQRPPWKDVLSVKVADEPKELPWQKRDFDEIRKAVAAQKGRQGRIKMPPEGALKMLPEAARERTKKINWSHASLGYQPALTAGWFASMDTFGGEAQIDRVFSNTLFWTVTRGVDCFY